MQPVVTAAEMQQAETRCFASGTPSLDVMEKAGAAVADLVNARFAPCPVAVLCGPGNNGGDGYVIARHLQASGFDVMVAALCPREQMRGDAATMAAKWAGLVEILTAESLQRLMQVPLWIDALFGTGLNRPLPEMPGLDEAWLAQEHANRPKIVAVDVPSGLMADRSDNAYCRWRADFTVTFGAKKICHVFEPARHLCGEVIVADIGLADFIETKMLEQSAIDGPALLNTIITPAHMHKYDRGALYVASGPRHKTGAARLAARAGLRGGAGVVTLLAPPEAMDMIAAHETAIMVDAIESAEDLVQHVSARRHSALVIGPAHGVTARTRQFVTAALKTGKPVVLDADALTAFAADSKTLFDMCHDKVVMTPHTGEFAKLFPAFSGADNPAFAASAAAKQSGAMVVLKGPTTVIAAPDGQVRINSHAAPWLATAGSGDVLAGLMGAMLLHYATGFEAACAAVWLHGACGVCSGPGLIAEDLPDLVPTVLRRL
jgi:ADP-dependent NAD(P)H-hydrate dehydratase / NAD(P)H-hydrate epimerase